MTVIHGPVGRLHRGVPLCEAVFAEGQRCIHKQHFTSQTHTGQPRSMAAISSYAQKKNFLRMSDTFSQPPVMSHWSGLF